MNKIVLGRWPEGKGFAVTFSYDDGRDFDLRLIELLDRYDFKGTFNLNSSRIGREGCVTEADIASAYRGHEIAAHTVTHPNLTHVPDTQVVMEALEDRRRLESMAGRIVNGMAYPNGRFDERVIKLLAAAGIVYSRTTIATKRFDLPEDWLAWHPTCHDREATRELIEGCLRPSRWAPPGRLLYIWGHSYEFEREGGWEQFEEVLRNIRELGGDNIWAATNGEIYRYVEARRRLEFAADGGMIYNPSALAVWVDVDGKPSKIEAGECFVC